MAKRFGDRGVYWHRRGGLLARFPAMGQRRNRHEIAADAGGPNAAGGTLVDPFGHKWHLATHVEDVPPKELKRRADEAFKKSSGG